MNSPPSLTANGGNLRLKEQKQTPSTVERFIEVERERKKKSFDLATNASKFTFSFVFARLIHSLASDNVHKARTQEEENTSLTTAPFG